MIGGHTLYVSPNPSFSVGRPEGSFIIGFGNNLL